MRVILTHLILVSCRDAMESKRTSGSSEGMANSPMMSSKPRGFSVSGSSLNMCEHSKEGGWRHWWI